MDNHPSLLYKTFRVGVIVLFIGFGVQPALAGVAKDNSNPLSKSKVLFVGGSGPGNYTRIQDAIDNASDGDTIFVFNGIYFENINIKKYGISLLGENKEFTIIDGCNKSSVIQINLGFSYVNISSFTIQNAGAKIGNYSGIEIFSSFNNITGNIIRNNPFNGIWIDTYNNAYSNDINNNIIIDNKRGGIFLDWSYPNNICNNYLENNSYYGISIGYSILPSFNKIISLDSGSIISKDYWSYVYRNIIRNNRIGIEIEGRGGIEVFENKIEDNEYGILLSAPYLINCGWNFFYQNNIMNNCYGIRFSVFKDEDLPDSFIRLNKIFQNNFVNNVIHVSGNCVCFNRWIRNYWDNWIGLEYKILRFFPYHINMTKYKNNDWHPVLKPYNIEI